MTEREAMGFGSSLKIVLQLRCSIVCLLLIPFQARQQLQRGSLIPVLRSYRLLPSKYYRLSDQLVERSSSSPFSRPIVLISMISLLMGAKSTDSLLMLIISLQVGIWYTEVCGASLILTIQWQFYMKQRTVQQESAIWCSGSEFSIFSLIHISCEFASSICLLSSLMFQLIISQFLSVIYSYSVSISFSLRASSALTSSNTFLILVELLTNTSLSISLQCTSLSVSLWHTWNVFDNSLLALRANCLKRGQVCQIDSTR